MWWLMKEIFTFTAFKGGGPSIENCIPSSEPDGKEIWLHFWCSLLEVSFCNDGVKEYKEDC